MWTWAQLGFLEDQELRSFLVSEGARYIYTRRLFLPFISMFNGQQCRRILGDPSPQAKKATRELVQQMANPLSESNIFVFVVLASSRFRGHGIARHTLLGEG